MKDTILQLHHRDKKGYIRLKAIITKQKQIIKQICFQNKKMQFWNLSQLQNKSFKNLRDLIEIKNKPINDQKYFSDSESTISSSMNVKRRIKNSYLRKPLRLSSWNQLINHIEFNTITLIQNQKGSRNQKHMTPSKFV